MPVPHYVGHVKYLATPFDAFMSDFRVWLDSSWYVWVGLAVLVTLTIAAAKISKARARARSRVPQYRRQLPTN